jgi:glucose/arabinose dehydrogenase
VKGQKHAVYLMIASNNIRVTAATHMVALTFLLALLSFAPGNSALCADPPFTIEGPGVNPDDFRVTTFATGVSYPVGMQQLSDGSLLVAVSDGPDFFTSNGRLLRFVDTDDDGVSDGLGQQLATGMAGGLTSLRIGGELVFVTGQRRPIYVHRMGATPGSQMTQIGVIDVNYLTSWLHPHSALGLRPTPGEADSYDLFFQLGSRRNNSTTSSTVTISSTNIAGATGTLRGDSIYRLTIIDMGDNVRATNLTQVANGLRNAAGFAFDTGTGDLYFQDNGIDGISGNANEPLSADELNFLSATDLSNAAVEFFGFPDNYTAYRTGTIVGGAGVQPLVAFQPLPDPLTGAEAEGPNDLVLAPKGFPDGLNDGIFIGFHGKFFGGGLDNEENPLVYVDLTSSNYFHFIRGQQVGLGHLDGLLSTTDSLFVSDISTSGGLSSNPNQGAIYQIKSIVGPAIGFSWTAGALELTWGRGVLQSALDIDDEWTDVPDATSPHTAEPAGSQRFFRLR